MNNTRQLILASLLGGVSLACVAAQPTATTTREERMDDALQSYRAAHPDAGTAASGTSTESGFTRGVKRTGQAIERGAERAGHAVRRGLEKTGDAAHRVGDKISEKVTGEKQP